MGTTRAVHLAAYQYQEFDAYASALAREKMRILGSAYQDLFGGAKEQQRRTYSIAAFVAESPLSDKVELAAVIDIRRQFAELVRAMPIDGSEYEVPDSESTAAIEPD